MHWLFALRFDAAVSGFIKDRRANFVMLTSLLSPIIIAAAAIGVDVGSLYAERREAQAAVDLAAISTATDLPNFESAALAGLKYNNVTAVLVEPSVWRHQVMSPGQVQTMVVKGHYSRDPSIPVDDRFQPGAKPSNAVKVTLRKHGELHFGASIIDPPIITVSAVASSDSLASFSIGSRLLSLDGGLINGLLGALLGGNVHLSVMDYQALLNTDVEVLPFLDALAVRLHSRAVTYSDLLSTEASVGEVIAAMMDVDGLTRETRVTLQALATATNIKTKLKIGQLLDAGPLGNLSIGDKKTALSAKAGVLDILNAAAVLANGDHQVAVNLGTAIPGLLDTSLNLTIGEPPQNSSWLAIGDDGAIVHTAQTRLLLKVQIAGAGLLSGVAITLPVYVEIAVADAKLTGIECQGGPSKMRVKVSARPGVATLRIASINPSQLSDFSSSVTFSPVTIAQVTPLIKVVGLAYAEVSNSSPSTLVFSSDEIADRVVKTVSTKNLSQSLINSLLDNLQLKVEVLGIGLIVPKGLIDAVAATLSSATSTIDPILDATLALVGVSVGEADVRVTAAVCQPSVLVQ